MRKFLAILKREYVQRLRAKMFIVTTIMFPLAMALFSIVPVVIMGMDVGSPMRLAVVDGTGKLFGRLRNELGNRETASTGEINPATGGDVGQTSRSQNLTLEEVHVSNVAQGDVKADLDRRLRGNEIDGFLLLPSDLFEGGKVQFFRRNTGDVITTRRVQQAIRSAVREQRLVDANVNAKTLAALSQPLDFETSRISSSGQERDAGGGFALVFAVGFIMYLTVLLYGQVVLGAIIEEKETRIAEILFSSIKPFTLMMGKLLGVSLVALTQLAIWGIAFAAFTLYGVGVLASKGIPANIPNIPLVFYIYFVLFFLLGYFVYSTLYALIGSAVTTPQEGGQLAMPIVLLLVVGFYFFLPVSRSPDSSFAFWISLVPFFAPITMLVRIVTQTPPFWQIALSLIIGFSTTGLLMWLASRVYRVGMLMYGKRASIPEMLRWVRQS